jgi:hypothetical protein
MEKRDMRTSTKNPPYRLIKNTDIFSAIKDRISNDQIGSTVIVPHVCNNINLFGAGFANDISHKFPVVKDNFHLLGKTAKLGQVQNILVSENKKYGYQLYISNMIAQNGIKNSTNPRPLNYGALAYCMNEIRNFAYKLRSSSREEKLSVEIHAPRFGSGLAGGDWDFIALMIEDIWSNIPVYIYNPIALTK